MKFKYIILSLCLAGLSACKQDAQVDKTQSLSVSKSAKHFVGKPHAPVAMNYNYLTTPELNKELEVKLDFKVSSGSSHLKITYHTKPALKSVDTTQPFEFYNLPQDSVESIVIKMIPQQVGQHMIYISASIDVNGVTQSRAFIVPVNISGADQQLNTQKIIKSNGMRYVPEQNVISMPASKNSN